MNRAHIEIEALAGLLAAPNDDPRRAHVRDCTRCQMALQMYTEFMQEPVPLSGAEREALDGRIRSIVDAGRQPEVGAMEKSEARNVAGFGVHRKRFAALWARPSWAIAASLLLFSGVLAWRELKPDRRAIVLRDSGGRQGAEVVFLGSPRTTGDGAVEIRWSPLPEADAYEVRLYTPELSEIARLGPIAESKILLRPGDPALSAAPETVLARVTALRESAPLGVSRLLTIPLR